MATHWENSDRNLNSTRHAPGETVRLNATEARQGRLGQPVLKVLIGGLVLAALAWGVAEFVAGEGADNDAATNRSDITAPAAPTAATPSQPTVDNTARPGEATQMAPVDRSPAPQSGTGGASQTTSPDGTVQ
ncbi:hypothetical protein BJF93_05430 [Xaviernesmea oryzae]|uniref:Uncharacterized protein n=1 Tax=Xaviernesmea oryzae TaxID=464029 RepID=A0A1Q9ART4_9HYPH|nr:hypothetical protein [Xaviernesmea oryzae]OLP58076.1 hypothetical protein BJF93_05430 [Xaviernesmea oryzae]SEL83522.1 hypothetical protein SAMN04487976_113119 [Xaviernesmea oryzae]